MKSSYENNKEILRKVTPAMAYHGEEIDVWQTAARERLRSLLGMDRFSAVDPDFRLEYENPGEEYTELRFTFQSEEAYRVPCHLLLPNGVELPPVMICLQGHSTGMHISLGVVRFPGDQETISGGDRDFCLRAVKEGYAAVALEQRDFGEVSSEEGKCGCFESSMTALLSGRTTIGERVWDVSRLIDVLAARFSDRLDMERIGVMGNSGGGTATAYIAALEERVRLAMPSCAMCTYRDSIGAMNHCSCNYVPHIAEYFDMGDLMAMAYPKYYIQVSGVGDSIFPISGAREVFQKGRALYQKGGLADRCRLVEGSGGHRFYADDAWPIVHRYFGTGAGRTEWGKE